MYVGYEDFVVHELPAWVGNRYNTRTDRDGVCMKGVSMCGFGASCLGLSNPDLFCALAIFEPAIEPSFAPQTDDRHNRFWRSTDQPMVDDIEHGLDTRFVEISPAKIMRNNAKTIRASGIESAISRSDKTPH